MKKCVYLSNNGSCGVREDGVASCPCEDYSDNNSKTYTYDRYFEARALSAAYPKPVRKNHFFWCLLAVLLAVLVFLFVDFSASLIFPNLAMGAERTITHYDKDGNRTGYTRIEDGKESHFDKGWNRSGYSIRNDSTEKTDHYDRDWNRQGHDEIEPENERDQNDN